MKLRLILHTEQQVCGSVIGHGSVELYYVTELLYSHEMFVTVRHSDLCRVQRS